ncbi:MAG: hypothetical protein GXY49_12610 [Syntrophomonadaceae bacterium]|nr:hypothetical protein [Syntrophomonadaceae bacterium]
MRRLVRVCFCVACFMLICIMGGCTSDAVATLASSDVPSEQKNSIPSMTGRKDIFTVEDGFTSKATFPEEYKQDHCFPYVSDSVPNGDIINKAIAIDYDLINRVDLGAISDPYSHFAPIEGFTYTWSKISYEVSNQEGICCLTIIDTTTSAYGSYSPNTTVNCYYYNENTQQVMDREQFIEALGLSQKDIILAYIAECCPAYKVDDISFNRLFFYYDKYNELRFVFNETAFK